MFDIFCQKGVFPAVSSLNPSKSFGSSIIITKILKLLKDENSPYLSVIYNIFFYSGIPISPIKLFL